MILLRQHGFPIINITQPKGGFDYYEKVFQITILNADYHDYCYVLPASPGRFR